MVVTDLRLRSRGTPLIHYSRAVLLAIASSTTLVGRRASRPVSQAERICFLRLRPAEMGARTMHQQAPDVAVSALGNMPSRSLPPLECCCGTRPSQAANWRAERNLSGSADARHDGGRGNQADPGDLGQSAGLLHRRNARRGASSRSGRSVSWIARI